VSVEQYAIYKLKTKWKISKENSIANEVTVVFISPAGLICGTDNIINVV